MIGTTQSLSFNDPGRTPNSAYVYRVYSIDAAGNKSANGYGDFATTVQFTDPTITAGMTIKRQHVLELREAANLARAAAGVPTMTFAEALSSTSPIKATHIYEVRDALLTLKSSLHMYTTPPLTFTDSNLSNKTIKALHMQELMNAVR